MKNYAIGLDYGTNSVRALVVDVADGREIGGCTWAYEHGEEGIIVNPADPDEARQHPADYIKGLEQAAKSALREAGDADPGFSGERVIGIGIDTTGSTPIPVDATGRPLALAERFADNRDAMAWLWKDHTAHAEAEEITALAASRHPEYLAKCGGTYSSEWYWSKLLHAARSAPEVCRAAHSWVECADWIPALLTGTDRPERTRRCVCAAGHKALYHPDWGGFPDPDFLAGLHPELGRFRAALPERAVSIAQSVGGLTRDWAQRLGLRPAIPVAAGAFDAHLGAVGSGIRPGVLVKIIGTSTCDMAVAPLDGDLPDIPGLCGIVPESILPGFYGLEAGQSACGDIFNWFVNRIAPHGSQKGSHESLTAQAERLRPGESGLLALDWHNGNRTVLVDQRLTGLVLGLTLHTEPAEIYRAWIEATAFGARTILQRFEEYGVPVERVINCGGISSKNPLVMQIYADVLGRPLEISRSSQTCALGAAMAGAVVAGSAGGGYDGFRRAAEAMTGTLDKVFVPQTGAREVYERLYAVYKRLHDIFGTEDYAENQSTVMKELLRIRDEVRERG